MTLPKQSKVFVSMTSPGFTRATGSATPKTYFRSLSFGS
jgi:hypothetical protein